MTLSCCFLVDPFLLSLLDPFFAAVSEQLVKLMSNFKIGGKQVHDANIVATMLAYDIPCLLTHNVKDFRKYEDTIKIEGIG